MKKIKYMQIVNQIEKEGNTTGIFLKGCEVYIFNEFAAVEINYNDYYFNVAGNKDWLLPLRKLEEMEKNGMSLWLRGSFEEYKPAPTRLLDLIDKPDTQTIDSYVETFDSYGTKIRYLLNSETAITITADIWQKYINALGDEKYIILSTEKSHEPITIASNKIRIMRLPIRLGAFDDLANFLHQREFNKEAIA